MIKYYKIIEIDHESFIKSVGTDLECGQMCECSDGTGFVAADDAECAKIILPMIGLDEE